MAMARGLVSLEDLQNAFSRAKETGSSPLDALTSAGVLDDTDLEVLAKLVGDQDPSSPGLDPRAFAPDISFPQEIPANHPSGPELKMLWAALPKEKVDASGRCVQRVITLPAWKQYRNLRFVSEGGMGRIFKAFDPSLKRTVALKFLRRDEPELVMRFALEAQHQAMVDHPNVCKVYEVGDWQGQSYIAMQFIRGDTLETAGPKMTLNQKVEVMETVADAIQSAHRQGLIHRDLKPANIMVELTEDGVYKPCVLDFGLARGAVPSGLTIHGLAFGTSHYMSPEQARGDTEQVGRRTDVYALGATLYKLLTRQAPFGGCDPAECMRRTLEEEPVPVRQLAPEVPEDFETIVMKCLEKAPEKRYESARALAEDLRRFREDEPILAHTPTFSYRAGKYARKHKTLMALAGVAILAILVLTIVGVRIRLTATERARWAQHYGQNAERIEALVRYIRIMPLHDTRKDMAAVQLQIQNLETEVSKASQLRRAPGSYALGRAYLALGQPMKARQHLDFAWTHGFQTPDVAYTLGTSMGAIYQRELDRLSHIPDLQMREAKKQELVRTLLAPARKLLSQGANASMEPPPFQEGRSAFLDNNLDVALTKARQAWAMAPWFFESKALEGDVLIRLAGDTADPRSAVVLLRSAAAAFREAQTIAPSDLELYLGEAQAWRAAMIRTLQLGGDPGEFFDACSNACSRALKVRGGDPDAHGMLAWAWGERGKSMYASGKSPVSFLKESIRHAEVALDANPSHVEARLACATSKMVLGLYMGFDGKDALPFFTDAIAYTQKALDLDSLNAQAAFQLSQACTYKMKFEMSHGMAPWASFETGLKVALEGERKQPRIAYYPFSAGTLYVERAEYERTHGINPIDSTAAALLHFKEAARLWPQDHAVNQGICTANRIKGTYLLATGQDPSGALEAAVVAGRKAQELKPTAVENELVNALTSQAEWALETNQSPDVFIAEAEKQIEQAKGHAMSNDMMNEFGLLGMRIDELKARRAVEAGGNPEPHLNHALALANSQKMNVLLTKTRLMEALIHLDFARWTKKGSQTHISPGLEAVTSVLRVDPRSAEAYLIQGGLLGCLARQDQEKQETDKHIELSKNAFRQAVVIDRNLQQRAMRMQTELGVAWE